jgi:FMN phosphatase YigB (HAD superfamily)
VIVPFVQPVQPADSDVAPVLRNIRGIIFDFDGTLYDYTWLPFRIIAANPMDMFRIRAERVVRKRFSGRDYGTPAVYYREYFALLAKLCRRSEAFIKKWYFNRYIPRMIRALKRYYTPRQGVKELLARMGSPLEAHRLEVALYSDYPALRERMGALGLFPGSTIKLYGPESFGAQKPAPRPFLSIAREMGILPEETLVVGDREDTDGMGAQQAGMRFFCLETGRKRHFRLDPDRQISVDEQPRGPSLTMYGGSWDKLYGILSAYVPRAYLV